MLQEVRNDLYNRLRCYQKEACDQILDIFYNSDSVIANNYKINNDGRDLTAIIRQNYTGTGKSVEQNFLAVDWLSRSEDNAYLFLIHREELLDNAAGYFESIQTPYTFIRKAHKTQYSKRAFLAGVDYFRNEKRLEEFKKYLADYKKNLFIVIDECHHVTSKSWSKIVEYFPEAHKVGFTATLERLDGKGFDTMFQHLIPGKPYQWYIDNKFIAPFQLVTPKLIDIQVSSGKSDDLAQQEEAMTDEVLGDAVEIWKEFTPGLKTFTFCPSIGVSKRVAELYNRFGREVYGRDIAVHLDGGKAVKKEDRDENYLSPSAMKKLRSESIKRFGLPIDHDESLLVLTNVELFIEGINVPSAQVTQHLRLTKSEIFFDQMNGRSNRYAADKTQYILDHVGNLKLHGIPNRERFLSLEGRKKRENAKKYELRCHNCEEILCTDYRQLPNPGGWFQCDHCGTNTAIPFQKLQTRRKKEEGEDQLNFTDAKFIIIDSNNYTRYNEVALFNKYAKTPDNRFLDKIIKHPLCDINLLVNACKFRALPERWAISAWSRKVGR